MKRIITFLCLMFVASSLILAEPFADQVASQDLFAFVQKGNRKAVKKMLLHGAAVNTLNDQGKTVLDIAVERNHFKIARDLLRCGARVTTELNAQFLKEKFKNRARRFFISGFFVTPFLWIGTYVSINEVSNILVLTK